VIDSFATMAPQHLWAPFTMPWTIAMAQEAKRRRLQNLGRRRSQTTEISTAVSELGFTRTSISGHARFTTVKPSWPSLTALWRQPPHHREDSEGRRCRQEGRQQRADMP